MFVTNSSKFNELCTTQYFLYTATKCVCFIRKICAISSINVMWHNDGDFSAHLPLHDGTVIICQYVMVFLFVHRCSDGNVPRGTRRRKPSRDKVALRGKGPPQRVRTGKKKKNAGPSLKRERMEGLRGQGSHPRRLGQQTCRRGLRLWAARLSL